VRNDDRSGCRHRDSFPFARNGSIFFNPSGQWSQFIQKSHHANLGSSVHAILIFFRLIHEFAKITRSAYSVMVLRLTMPTNLPFSKTGAFF